MCKYMTEIVTSKHLRSAQWETHETNLLSIAFKNVVGPLRCSWRCCKSNVATVENQDLLDRYTAKVENELEQSCLEVFDLFVWDCFVFINCFSFVVQMLQLLEHKLLPTCSKGDEAQMFFERMCGDFYRYLAHIGDTEEYKNSSKDHYEVAYTLAKKFYPEIRHDQKEDV